MGDVYSVPSARGCRAPHVRGKWAVTLRSDSLLLRFAGPAGTGLRSGGGRSVRRAGRGQLCRRNVDREPLLRDEGAIPWYVDTLRAGPLGLRRGKSCDSVLTKSDLRVCRTDLTGCEGGHRDG